jgi:Amt family ammonium transporter
MVWCATNSATRPKGTRGDIDTGDTTWLLVSCALVLLMTPGLSLFYGGLVR